MLKRFLKMVPVLLTVVLLAVMLLSGAAQASDCAHEWSEWSGRDGMHRRECKSCGSVESGECDYYSIILRPTCTEGGHTEKTCKLCGDSVIADKTPAGGHKWDDGVQTLAPTCVEEGEMLFTCLMCAEQKTQAVAATGEHNVVTDPAVEPTCAAQGKTEGAHCGFCGEVFIAQKPIEKLSHEWDYENTVLDPAPTCQPGVEKAYCKNCDAVGQRTLPAVQEHKRRVVSIEVPATCTEDGKTQHVICSVCETVLYQSEVLPATGHDWQVTVHTEQTCLTDGLCDRYCKYCGASDIGLVMPAKGHTFVNIPAKAATCTQKGYTASRYCSVCDYVQVESVETDALGHNYEMTSTRNPTCTADGKKVFDCTRCTASYSEKIDKLGHDLYEATRTEPTCTSMGLILQKCKRCSHTLSQSIKALGHDEVFAVLDPTCTEGGFTTVTCTRCDYTGQINPTEPTGHDGEVYETVAATCTTGGYEKHRCTVCGFEFEANHVPEKGHTYAPGLVVAPTCTEDGYTVFNCLYCSESKQQNPIAASGHKLTAAESNHNGTHTGLCTVCNESVAQACSGGVVSCMQQAVCEVCNTVYKEAVGVHEYTKYTILDDAYHRLDCANCPTTGEENEKHSFARGEFVPEISAFVYSCRSCLHKVWGRPIGDADGNGIVGDASDARFALRVSVGLETPTEAAVAAADVDRDGAVTANDARAILRVSAGLDEKKWSVLFVTENGSLPN